MASDKTLLYVVLALVVFMLLSGNKDYDDHYKKPFQLARSGTTNYYTLADDSSPTKAVDLSNEGLGAEVGMKVKIATTKTGTPTYYYISDIVTVGASSYALGFSLTEGGSAIASGTTSFDTKWIQ